MTNEEIIQRLKSIEADVGALMMHLINDEPAPAAEPTAIDKFLEPAKSKPATLEDVRAALTTLAGVKGAAHVKGLLADYGAKKLSELAPIHFTAVLLAANAEASDND